MKKVLVISLFLLAGIAVAAEKKTVKTEKAAVKTTQTTKTTTDMVRSFGGFPGESSAASTSTKGK